MTAIPLPGISGELDQGQQMASKKGMSLSTKVMQVLARQPDRKFFPREIATDLDANSNSVTRVLNRFSRMGTGSGPVVKVGHGLYQYCPEKQNGLKGLLAHFGKVGIENLIYVMKAGTPCQDDNWGDSSSEIDTDPTQTLPRPGYPRSLSTGQEIRWEAWSNDTEKISFVSNGNPFSPDLVLYLHEELMKIENFDPALWKRTSIEINIDGNQISLSPESVTLQDTAGLLSKFYNHGMQARFEVADRRPVSLKDSLSFLFDIADHTKGQEALKKSELLEKKVESVDKRANLAYKVASKLRDK